LREGAKIQQLRHQHLISAGPHFPLHMLQGLGPSTQHIQGLGRQCLYLPQGDTWASRGWSFGDVACDECPKKKECPSYQQFWDEADATFSVHAIQNWRRPGVLILDELPYPVTTSEYDLDCLARTIFGPMHKLIVDWRTPIYDQLRRVYDTIVNQIYDNDAFWPEFGETLDLARIFDLSTESRQALDYVANYLEVTPIPKAPPPDVRAGRITSGNWPANYVGAILDGLVRESQQTPMTERRTAGSPRLAIRVYGDKQGRYWKAEYELRRIWHPPAEPHIILDSTAGTRAKLYEALYPNADVKKFIHDVAVPGEHIQALHYDTLGFAKRRCLDGNALTDAGVNTVVRALRELTYHARLIGPPPTATKPRVGVIGHRTILLAMGFDFRKGNRVLRDGKAARIHSAMQPMIETALRDLEAVADLVVGYHGGVIGSNLFEDVRVLAVLGDPTAHIGKLTEEARVIGLDPQGYIDSTREAAAIQEVFRARLLDAGPNQLKTVLFFGGHPPVVTGMGWVKAPWAQGGRLPALAQTRLEAALAAATGLGGAPFYGTYSTQLLCRLHATPNRSPLLALRAAGIDTEAPTRAEWEMYRRAATTVARREGLSPHEMSNPLGDRRAIVVWAKTRNEADVYLAEAESMMRLIPEDRLGAIVAGAAERDEEREIQEALAGEIEEVRVEVSQLTLEMNAALSTMKPEVQAPVKAKYRARIREALVRWRELRASWKGAPRRAIDVEMEYRGLLPSDQTVRPSAPRPPLRSGPWSGQA